MTIDEAYAIFNDKKGIYWSRHRQEAEETAKKVIDILTEFSEVSDAKEFINKLLEKAMNERG